MKYEDLEKHYSCPKQTSFSCKRVPRKFKKKWKHVLQNKQYKFLTLNQKLWFIQGITNINYNRFLIKKICEHNNP